jgi:hypothetical protein
MFEKKACRGNLDVPTSSEEPEKKRTFQKEKKAKRRRHKTCVRRREVDIGFVD